MTIGLQVRDRRWSRFQKANMGGERSEGRVERKRKGLKKEESNRRYLIILQFDMCNNQLE